MQLENYLGLTLARVDADEALATDWIAHRGAVDLVRVTDLSAGAAERLVKAGFVIKPEWLIWLAPAGADEEEFLSRLSTNARYLYRKSLRRTAESGISIHVERPIEAETLDRFLAVYESRVNRMRNGLVLAPRERDGFLTGGSEHLLVSAVREDEMIGGCICHYDSAESMLRVRFVAVTPDYQQDSVTRALYAAAFDSARALGCSIVSLGLDLNLYGHVVQPGLFSFKTKLGFTAKPLQQVMPGRGTDMAERVLRLDNLTDPTLILGYQQLGVGATAVSPALHGEIFTNSQSTDVRSLAADFLAGTQVTVLAP